MKVNSHVFLCGYFSVSEGNALPTDWVPVPVGEKLVSEMKNYYSPGFVSFYANDVSVFRKEVGQPVCVPFGDGGPECPFLVDSIYLYRMPRELFLCTVKLVFTEVDLNAQSRVLGALRNCCSYDRDLLEPFITCAISPLDRTYSSLTGGQGLVPGGNYAHLVENGNKFKLFQLIQSDGIPDDPQERDRLLFSAGSLAPYSPGMLGAVDPRYFSRIMDASRIAVFSSWSALVLLDTFTALSKPLPPYVEGIWLNDYFGMIYLYELYRKSILYHFNSLFREGETDPSLLKKRFGEFERKYTFTSISYNFLPTEIDRCIVKGLEMDKEDDRLAHFLSQEVSAREEESDRRREHFLLFLTLLAGFSALWDMVSLLDKLVGFDSVFASDFTGYRLATSILLLVIAYVAYRIVRKKR